MSPLFTAGPAACDTHDVVEKALPAVVNILTVRLTRENGQPVGVKSFVGTGVTRQLQIRDAVTGNLVSAIPLQAPSDSGSAVVHNAVIFGLGSSEQGSPAGIAAYTPSGVPPSGG